MTDEPKPPAGTRWERIRSGAGYLLWRSAMRFSQSPVLPNRARLRILRALGCSIHPSATIADGVFIGSSRITFGKYAGCAADCFLDGTSDVILEDFVRLGSRVIVITGTHDIEPNVVRRDLWAPVIAKPVHIGYGSWIGTGVTIMPGVRIGEGCVVAAGSIVTRDLEPNGLYAGAPAKRIKDLPITEG